MDKCGNAVFFKDGKLFFNDDKGVCNELIIIGQPGKPGNPGRPGNNGSSDSIYVDIFNTGMLQFGCTVSPNATLPITYKWDVSSALGFNLGNYFELNNGTTFLAPLVDITVDGADNLPTAQYSFVEDAVNAGLVKITVTDADGRIGRDYRMVFSLIQL